MAIQLIDNRGEVDVPDGEGVVIGTDGQQAAVVREPHRANTVLRAVQPGLLGQGRGVEHHHVVALGHGHRVTIGTHFQGVGQVVTEIRNALAGLEQRDQARR